jgi:NADP-dependent 3-hydroxy acid dehydrogenase YdfG
MNRSSRTPEVVVITGAGAGLGRAIVQSFAKRGARIGLVSRGEERLEDAKRSGIYGRPCARPARRRSRSSHN